MKTIEINTFDQKSRGGGIWTLHDGNEADRMLRQALEPEVEVEKLLTPTKYIKDGEYLVIVQVTKEGPVLIKRCHKRYVDVSSDKRTGGIKLYIERGKIEPIVENYDYVDERYKTEEEIIEDMVATGYITREEWDKYINPENRKGLPLVKYDAIWEDSYSIPDIISISEANQNFTRATKIVDEQREVIILKHNKPKYVIMDYDKYVEDMDQLKKNRK